MTISLKSRGESGALATNMPFRKYLDTEGPFCVPRCRKNGPTSVHEGERKPKSSGELGQRRRATFCLTAGKEVMEME
jgi:hypothetical protein